MSWKIWILVILALFSTPAALAPKLDANLSDILEVYGRAHDQFGRPIDEAKVFLYIDGKLIIETKTLPDGSYLISTSIPSFSGLHNITIRFSKFAHKQVEHQLSPSEMVLRTSEEGRAAYTTRRDAILATASRISTGGWVALLIFLVTYVLILGGFVDRTVAAMTGAFLMLGAGLAFGFMDQGAALSAVDFNVIGLLMGMMIMVNVLKPTGFFEALAIGAATLAHNSAWRLLILMSISTALISMFIDNVTSILLIVPVTIVIAESLSIDPVPILLSEALLSNVGGVGTLVGDPPNVMIASAASLTFNQFIMHLLPLTMLTLLATLAFFYFFFRKWRKETGRLRLRQNLRIRGAIRDPKGMTRSLVILAATIVLFSFQGHLPLSIAALALLGATMALLFGNQDIEGVLREVEWKGLFFFAGLFILVGGLSRAGILDMAAGSVISFTGGGLILTTVAIIWVSAAASAFVDNIPFVATMIPIVRQIGHAGLNANPLWWALAVGAGFGGNGTPIGASANVITIIISERSNHPVTTRLWLRAGLPVMIISCLIGTVVMIALPGLFSG